MRKRTCTERGAKHSMKQAGGSKPCLVHWCDPILMKLKNEI